MTSIRITTGLVAIVMATTIVYGFVSGDFGDEGRMILEMAWGRVSLVDLYLGLVLFGGWIVIRERSARALPWLAALLVLGNLAAAVYAFIAAVRTDSPSEFLVGDTAR